MKPYKITFEIETQDEHNQLYFLFNHGDIIDGLPDLMANANGVRKQLTDKAGVNYWDFARYDGAVFRRRQRWLLTMLLTLLTVLLTMLLT